MLRFSDLIFVSDLPVKNHETKPDEPRLLSTEIDFFQAVVKSCPSYFSPERAEDIFFQLRSAREKGTADKGVMWGKKWESKRRSIQIADEGVRLYNYTGASATKTVRFEKYPVVGTIRRQLEKDLGAKFNFCLVNFYTSDAHLGWHSDAEEDMVRNSVIASISLGDPRRFKFRLRDNLKKSLDEDELEKAAEATSKTFELTSGYLLTMEGRCQGIFQHSILPATKKELQFLSSEDAYGMRVNLTFRLMKSE